MASAANCSVVRARRPPRVLIFWQISPGFPPGADRARMKLVMCCSPRLRAAAVDREVCSIGSPVKGAAISETPTMRIRWSRIFSDRPGRYGSPGKNSSWPPGSMMAVSSSRIASARPTRIRFGSPARLASSIPSTVTVLSRPPSERPMASILSSGAAQAMPGTPRTRINWMSRIALTWSKHSTSGSVTHRSASSTSRICAAVMDSIVARIAA